MSRTSYRRTDVLGYSTNMQRSFYFAFSYRYPFTGLAATAILRSSNF